MSATKIGTFTLGGIPWTIELDNETCIARDSTFCFNSALQIIKLRDTYGRDKLVLPYKNVTKTLWEAILNEVICKTMEYRKLNVSEILVPYASLLFQVTETLTSKPGEWDGSFDIGGRTYNVVVDNRENDGWYGLCCNNEATIYLTTEGEDGPYTDSFTLQTLWHEILHAIAFELGRGNHKINSEKFVNPLSIFVTEIVSTLKIKFPDE